MENSFRNLDISSRRWQNVFLVRIIHWVWAVLHFQEWLCSSFCFCWQPGSGSLSQDLCRAVGWVLGQELQEPLGAQVEPRGAAAPRVNCQQQSWHTAHCLLLINASFSQAERLGSSEGSFRSAELVATVAGFVLQVAEGTVCTDIGIPRHVLSATHSLWLQRAPGLPSLERDIPAGSRNPSHDSHFQWNGQCFCLGEATSTPCNPSWLSADPSSSQTS